MRDSHFLRFFATVFHHPASKRKDLGEDGRFRYFSIEQIKERNYKLDISWLKDDTLEDDGDLPPPQDLATEAITELEAVVDDLRDIIASLENGNGEARV